MEGEFYYYHDMDFVEGTFNKPSMPQHIKEIMLKVYNQIANYFTADEDLVEIEMFSGKRVTGILRSGVVQCPPRVGIIIWGRNKPMPDKDYDLDLYNKEMEIPIIGIRNVKIIKNGQGRFTDEEFEDIEMRCKNNLPMVHYAEGEKKGTPIDMTPYQQI